MQLHKKYPIYHMTFYDHVQTQGDNMNVVLCEAIGYLVQEDDLAYYLASWVCESIVNNHNTEVFGILKSTVIDKKKLK